MDESKDRLYCAPGTMMTMIEIPPTRVELEREEEGRMFGCVPDFPGVMAYGATEEEAVRKVKSLTLQVLADMIESGEDVPAGRSSPACPGIVTTFGFGRVGDAGLTAVDPPHRSRFHPEFHRRTAALNAATDFGWRRRAAD